MKTSSKNYRERLRNSVSRRLKDQETTSPDRRRYLQKLARLMTREHSPSVQFESVPTAHCRHNAGDIEIGICEDAHSQTVTNIDRKLWTLIVQEALLTHEMGHALYTDFDAHESIKEDLGMKEMSRFHDVVWNPAEDAAIEEQLRWKFDCGNQLDMLNANLFEGQKSNSKYLSLMDATKLAILEKGVYDTGIIDEHLADSSSNLLGRPDESDLFDDEILPYIEKMLADVITEPDPEKRYEVMLEFWQWLKDAIKDSGKSLHSEMDDMSDFEEVKPDDTSGMTNGRAADELEELDAQDVLEDIQDEDANDESDAGDGGDGTGEPMDSQDDSNPSDENESGQSGGEDAQNDGDAEGGMPGDGDGLRFPGHEGHEIVVKE